MQDFSQPLLHALSGPHQIRPLLLQPAASCLCRQKRPPPATASRAQSRKCAYSAVKEASLCCRRSMPATPGTASEASAACSCPGRGRWAAGRSAHSCSTWLRSSRPATTSVVHSWRRASMASGVCPTESSLRVEPSMARVKTLLPLVPARHCWRRRSDRSVHCPCTQSAFQVRVQLKLSQQGCRGLCHAHRRLLS